jgi:hypothetical protein
VASRHLRPPRAFDFATENGVCQDILGPWAGRILAVLSQSALGDVFKLSVSGLGRWRCTGMLVGEGVRSVGL